MVTKFAKIHQIPTVVFQFILRYLIMILKFNCSWNDPAYIYRASLDSYIHMILYMYVRVMLDVKIDLKLQWKSRLLCLKLDEDCNHFGLTCSAALGKAYLLLSLNGFK